MYYEYVNKNININKIIYKIILDYKKTIIKVNCIYICVMLIKVLLLKIEKWYILPQSQPRIRERE